MITINDNKLITPVQMTVWELWTLEHIINQIDHNSYTKVYSDEILFASLNKKMEHRKSSVYAGFRALTMWLSTD